MPLGGIIKEQIMGRGSSKAGRSGGGATRGGGVAKGGNSDVEVKREGGNVTVTIKPTKENYARSRSQDEDDLKLAAADRQEKITNKALDTLGKARFKKTVERNNITGKTRTYERLSVPNAGSGEVKTFSVGKTTYHMASANNVHGETILNKSVKSSAAGKKAIKEALRKELEG